MRCRFAWTSPGHGPVRCWHQENDKHDRHEAWTSRRERRRRPKTAASWVAVAASEFCEKHEALADEYWERDTYKERLEDAYNNDPFLA